GAGVARQDLAVRFQRQLEAAQLKQQQGQVEARGGERPLKPQRGPERLDRGVGVLARGLDNAEVVPRQRVLQVHLDRLAVRGDRLRRAARLVQNDAVLVPELGRVGDFAEQRFVQLQGGREVALQEV